MQHTFIWRSEVFGFKDRDTFNVRIVFPALGCRRCYQEFQKDISFCSVVCQPSVQLPKKASVFQVKDSGRNHQNHLIHGDLLQVRHRSRRKLGRRIQTTQSSICQNTSGKVKGETTTVARCSMPGVTSLCFGGLKSNLGGL